MLPLGPVVTLPLNRTWAESRLTGLGSREREYHAKRASQTQILRACSRELTRTRPITDANKTTHSAATKPLRGAPE